MKLVKNEKGAIQLIVFIGVILILTVVLFVSVVYMVYFKKNTNESDVNNKSNNVADVMRINEDNNSVSVEWR